MAIELATSNIPESISMATFDVAHIRRLLEFTTMMPPSIGDTRLGDRITEATDDEIYRLLSTCESYNELVQAVHEGDGAFNMMRALINQQDNVAIEVMIETSDGCTDYEIELRSI